MHGKQDLFSANLALEIAQHGNLTLQIELICCSGQSNAKINDRLESITPQWQALAKDASAANPFFEPWSLIPALTHLTEKPVDLLIVWQSDTQQKMLMLLPLVNENRFHHIPLQHTTLWRHPYCFLCTPLISPLFPLNGWLSLLSNISKSLKLGHCVTHSWLNAEQVLVAGDATSSDSDWNIHLDRQIKSRASVVISGDFPDYLSTLRTKKRKDLQRNRRRLSELGKLEVSVVSQREEDSARREGIVDEFLTLENTGWKKDGCTAIASDAHHELYFRQLINNGLQSGQLQIMKMALDNKPVAMLIVMVSACGKSGYTLKIATDSEFNKYSPGSLIILEFTEHAFANLNLKLLDSCAAENHPMINSLWKHRVTLDNLTLVRKNDWRNLVVDSVRWLRTVRRKSE